MLITPSFKKSLIVEQFQRNYLKFKNYESVQHRPQFSGIKKGAKISFYRHFKFLKKQFGARYAA